MSALSQGLLLVAGERTMSDSAHFPVSLYAVNTAGMPRSVEVAAHKCGELLELTAEARSVNRVPAAHSRVSCWYLPVPLSLS